MNIGGASLTSRRRRLGRPINTSMNAGPITATHGPWIVEFTDFRIRDDKQRKAIESLSRPLLDEVLKIWLRVVTPGAHIVERPGTPIRTIVFLTRAAGRRFCSCFGGRMLATLSQ